MNIIKEHLDANIWEGSYITSCKESREGRINEYMREICLGEMNLGWGTRRDSVWGGMSLRVQEHSGGDSSGHLGLWDWNADHRWQLKYRFGGHQLVGDCWSGWVGKRWDYSKSVYGEQGHTHICAHTHRVTKEVMSSLFPIIMHFIFLFE